MNDYVPEDRPDQEDLELTDSYSDQRLLWQLRLNRYEAAKTWAAWLRESHSRRLQNMDGPVVRISAPPVPNMPRFRDEANKGSSKTEEGGDN